LENGADVNAMDKYGYMALLWVTDEGSKAMLKLLIEKGVYIVVEGDKALD
jgi:ankyrin repeat protein